MCPTIGQSFAAACRMPRRPSRVRGFPYVGCYRYFVTTCTFLRKPYFADPEHARNLAARIVPLFAAHSFEVVAYCVMPDHVHLLVEGFTDNADFRRAIRVWKLQSGHAWRVQHENPLWQIGYWERVLRDGDDIRAIVRYVLENPVRAGLSSRGVDYPFSGSTRFSLEELAEHGGDWNPPWKTSRSVGRL